MLKPTRRCPAERHELITSNTGLASMAIKRARRKYPPLRGIEWEELWLETMPALVRAARDFNPTLGVKFSTFATVSMIHQLASLAGYLTCNKRLGQCREVSLTLLTTGDDSSHHPMELAELSAPTEETHTQAEARRLVERALLNVHPEYLRVLKLRFFSGLTLGECALILGVSKERVRQREALGLARARMALGVNVA